MRNYKTLKWVNMSLIFALISDSYIFFYTFVQFNRSQIYPNFSNLKEVVSLIFNGLYPVCRLPGYVHSKKCKDCAFRFAV